KSAFARWKAVNIRTRVPAHEAVLEKLTLDRLHRRDDPRVLRRKEADLRHHEQARVEIVGAVILSERVALSVPAFLADLVVNLSAQCLQISERRFRRAALEVLARAI